jgi:thiol-disulfide isomerase/thioredoxin
MIRRVGIVILVSVALVGCQKRENSQAKDTTARTDGHAAATSPTQKPPSETPSAAQKPQGQSAQASRPAGPRRTAEVNAYPLEGLTWIKGGPVTITPGNVYVVEFWATWCPPCKISIPHLAGLQKKYKDKGVVFTGVSDEPPDVTTPFVKQMGDSMNYNVASDTKGDVEKGYMVAFHQDGIPTAFVVGAAGKIVWFGHPMDEQFEQAIDLALAAKPNAPARN